MMDMDVIASVGVAAFVGVRNYLFSHFVPLAYNSSLRVRMSLPRFVFWTSVAA